MPAAARVASLQAGITRLRKKWSLPPTNRTAAATSAASAPELDDGGQHLAQEHQRPGAVAVVALVAHLHHLADDRGDVDRAERRARRSAAAARGRRPSSAAARSPRRPYAPYRSTLPRPSLSEHHDCVPCTSSRRQNTHIDGETTPAIGPTAPRCVARLPATRLAGGEHALGVLGRRGEPLEQHRADQRSAHRPGRALPLDRRPGVQELAALEAERLRRGEYVDQVRLRAEHRRERLRVRRRAPRVAHHRDDRGRVAGSGGRQSTRETSTACRATASASSEAPAVTTAVGLARRS